MTDKPLYIKFYHPDIENFSDGTLRKLIREFSKLARELLLEEIEMLLSESELNFRQQQSARDIVHKEFLGGSNFLVEEIEKGSFKLVGILTVGALAIYKSTIARSIERAYDKSDLGKEVDEIILNAFNKLAKHLKNRNKEMKKLTPKLKKRVLANSFQVDNVTLEKKKNKDTVVFDIISLEERLQQIHEIPTEDDLQKTLAEDISILKKKIKKN